MRRVIKKTEIVVILLVVALSVAGLLYWNRDNGNDRIATITQNGVLVEEINLTKESETRILHLDDDVTIKIENHKIGFIESRCPDHLCEKTGMIDKQSETAVCLPKKTAIAIEQGKEADVDMIAG